MILRYGTSNFNFESLSNSSVASATILCNPKYHGLRTPNEGINQRYLKNWADVADKICCRHTKKFGSGSEFSAVQWRLFPLWASVVRGLVYRGCQCGTILSNHYVIRHFLWLITWPILTNSPITDLLLLHYYKSVNLQNNILVLWPIGQRLVKQASDVPSFIFFS